MSQKESTFTSDPSAPSDETTPTMDWSEESKKKSIIDFDYHEFETMTNDKKMGDLNLEDKLKAALCQAEKEGDTFASIGLKRILKHLGGEDTKPNYKKKINPSFDPDYEASKMLDTQQDHYGDQTKEKHYNTGFPKKNFNPKFNSGGPSPHGYGGRGGFNFNNGGRGGSNFSNPNFGPNSGGRGGGRGRGGPHGSGGRGGNFRGKYPPNNSNFH